MGIVKSRQVQKAAVEDKGRGWRSRRPGRKQIGSGAALVLGLAAWTLGDGYGAARAQTSFDSFSSPPGGSTGCRGNTSRCLLRRLPVSRR